MNERLPRRAFLGYASLGASALWLPRWLSAGFQDVLAAQDSSGADEEEQAPVPTFDAVLKASFERARAVGKPLLVFVVPRDKQVLRERQLVFGQYLNLCSAEALADLALCEVACAPASDLGNVFPDLGVAGEPWMFLVESDGAAPALRAIEGELPDLAPLLGSKSILSSADRDEAEREWELALLRRVERMAELVRAAVVGDPATLERRAARSRAVVAQELLELVERLVVNPSQVPAETVDQLAAPLRVAAEANPDRRAGCIEALAGAAGARLRTTPPPGAWWAEDLGCANHRLEGRTEKTGGAVACGMGYTPTLSRRFLHFYTSECSWF